MYQKIGGSAIKKDLKNIRLLLSYLNNPHHDLNFIHVAGTNGKGTTAHLIASVLQSSGLNVGLYTSPHYVDFRERIKINGQYISESYIVNFIKDIKQAIEDIEPSFFEITVAMALFYFKSEQVDIVVLETGLGGRLDSTNIIEPILSVITNISLDHQSMLGEDEFKIAGEKAGIIKANRPVVIGRFQPSCDYVFLKVAKINNADISFASLNWDIQEVETNEKYRLSNESNSYDFTLPDFSPFIAENITTALEAIHVYKNTTGHDIDDEDLQNGFFNFKSLSNFKGRWQILSRDPLMIADSAHNVDAIRKVLDYLDTQNYVQIHFVLGFVKEKNIEAILRLFDPMQRFYFTEPSVVRRLPVSDLHRSAAALNINGKKFENVHEAIAQASTNAGASDLIYIGGSSFIVADALGEKSQ